MKTDPMTMHVGTSSTDSISGCVLEHWDPARVGIVIAGGARSGLRKYASGSYAKK